MGAGGEGGEGDVGGAGDPDWWAEPWGTPEDCHSAEGRCHPPGIKENYELFCDLLLKVIIKYFGKHYLLCCGTQYLLHSHSYILLCHSNS